MAKGDIRILMDATHSALENIRNEQNKLQERCPHKVIQVKKYSWRVGSIQDVRMCSECDKVIEFLDIQTP